MRCDLFDFVDFVDFGGFLVGGGVVIVWMVRLVND